VQQISFLSQHRSIEFSFRVLVVRTDLKAQTALETLGGHVLLLMFFIVRDGSLSKIH
jgi:hypothetical protein